MEEIPQISGFEVVVLVSGIVQLFKELFSLEGKAAQALTFGVGLCLFGIWSAMQVAVLPEQFALWINLVARALGYTLAAPGLFKLVKHELLPAVGSV